MRKLGFVSLNFMCERLDHNHGYIFIYSAVELKQQKIKQFMKNEQKMIKHVYKEVTRSFYAS